MATAKEEGRKEQIESISQNKDDVPAGTVAELPYGDEPAAHLHAKTFLVVFAVYAIYFAQLINIVGLGALARDISGVVGGSSETTWLVTSVAILTAVLSPPVCQAADYWGRRIFLVVLTLLGVVGCIIIARATSMGMAIGGSVVVGASYGAQPLVHAIPSEVLPRRYRPYAQAGVNLASAAGGITALLMGGALTRHNNYSGFRSFWCIAAAIYAVATLICFFLYNPPLRELQKTLTFAEKVNCLDWVGYFLLAAGLVLFSLGLSYSENPYPWRSAIVLVPFLIGCALLIALVIYEWKFKSDGMFHHSLFSRDRNFPISLACVFGEGVIFYCANNYFAFEISTFYETDPLLVGVRYSVAFITYGCVTAAAGVYCSRYKKVRIPAVLGLAAFVIFNICMATCGPTTNARTWGFPAIVGFGLGVCLCALVTLAQLSTPPELISITSGLMIGGRSIAGVIGLAIYNAVFNSKISSHLGPDIAAAVLPLGLPASSLPALIGALAGGKTPTPETVPGVTKVIIEAGVGGLLNAYSVAFRYVWITAGVLSLCATIAAAFLFDPKQEFNMHIDAPAEKVEDLYDVEVPVHMHQG